MPSILENYEFADIVKGSDEDFMNIYGESDGLKVYKENIEYYSKNFIYTQGEQGAKLFFKGVELNFHAKSIIPKSTIGAGDNFNAGIVFGLLRENITREDLINGLSEEQWCKIVQVAIDFSSEVCTTLDNYVSVDFAKNYLKV